METVRKIGADIGFGSTVMAEVREHEIEIAEFPSVVGLGTADSGLLSVGLKRTKTKRPISIAWAAYTYLVGYYVYLHAQPVERLDFLRLARGAELQSLIYAGLWQLLGGGRHYVALLIGLPVSVMKDEAKAKVILQQLREWLIGEHNFSADKQSVSIVVTEVKVAAQPVGSYFAWSADVNGRWQQRREALTEAVGICDIGFNTLDLLAIVNGQIGSYATQGNNLGMHRVADFIIDYVHKVQGFTLSMYQADRLMRTYLEQGTCVLSHEGAEIPMHEVVKQAMNTSFFPLNEFIRRYWGENEFRYFLLTGGGALAYRNQLIEHYPHAYILPNAVSANAEGLAKLAARSATFKNGYSPV